MRTLLILATVTAAINAVEINPLMFVKNLRALSGSGLLASVEQDCEAPVKELGQCLSGQRKARHRLGRLFLRKSDAKLDALKTHPEFVQLKEIGREVDSCFNSNGCELRPMGAVKCLLDYVIYGGPYDRAAQCILDDWGVRGAVKTPEFGDLSALEDTVKLFAGVGLYKGLNKDRDAFWRRFGPKLEVFCPANRVQRVQSCIDRAAYQPENPLRLDLAKIGEDLKLARWEKKCAGRKGQRGCRNKPEASRLPPLLADSGVSVFGEKGDLAFIKDVLLERVMGCGVDLVVHENNLPIDQRASHNPLRVRQAAIIRMFRSENQCDMPKCIQFLWTVKDSLCGSCRGSIFAGSDPFGKRDNGFKCFARVASEEFVAVVAGPASRRQASRCRASSSGKGKGQGECRAVAQSRDSYQCRIPRPADLCESCSTAASRWRTDCVDPLAGYEEEARFVISLLKKICAFGKNADKITASDCPNYL